MDKFEVRLRDSDLREAAALADLLDSGEYTLQSTGEIAPVGDLLRTYQVRAEHLASFESPHARQLAASTAEFAERLAAEAEDGPVGLMHATGDGPESFSLFITGDGRILGCMRVISKLDVSEAEWAALWGQA